MGLHPPEKENKRYFEARSGFLHCVQFEINNCSSPSEESSTLTRFKKK